VGEVGAEVSGVKPVEGYMMMAIGVDCFVCVKLLVAVMLLMFCCELVVEVVM
jgi:hypothetical protein